MGCKKNRQLKRRKNRGGERLAEWRILKRYAKDQDKGYGLNTIRGRRIVDINFFIEQLKNVGNHNPQFACALKNMIVKGELKRGLRSGSIFECIMCGYEETVWTEPEDSSKEVDLNTAAVAGRRIVYVNFFIEQLKNVENHSPQFECSLKNMIIKAELKHGLRSGFTFECIMCGYEETLWTQPEDNSKEVDLNTAALAGLTNTTGRLTNLDKPMDPMNVTCMNSSKTYERHHNIECMGLKESTLDRMKLAAEEEVALGRQGDNIDHDISLLKVVADGSWAKLSNRQNFNSLPRMNEESEESLAKKKRVEEPSKTSLQTDSVGDRISSDGNTNNQASVSSVFIKQEILDPDIDMEEGTSGAEKPFEAVYLDSNIDKYNDEDLIRNKIKVEPLTELEEESCVLETFPEDIKPESLDIIDEQTITSENCPECGEDFEKVWDLEQHLKDKHSESESTKTLPKNLKQYSNKLKKLIDPPTQTASPPLLNVLPPGFTNVTAPTPTCSSSSSTESQGTSLSVPPLVPTSKSKQYVVLIPKKKQPEFLPVASSASPSLPPPPPSTISVSRSNVDSSETFTISLAKFSEMQRVALKKKMLEVIETVERLKIDPEMIVIAHKAAVKM